MSRLRAAARGEDEGQVMLLSLCFAVLCLLLVTVVASATSVHLERKRLAALADSLAIAAAADSAAYIPACSRPRVRTR